MGASRTLMMITQDNSHISDWTGQDFMIPKSKDIKYRSVVEKTNI